MSEPARWIEAAVSLAEAVKERDAERDSVVEAVLRHHVLLGIRDARAIAALCTAGLSDATQAHVRRLWENGVRVLYIMQDAESRSRSFLEEVWVEAYRTVNSAQSFASSPWAQRFLSDPRYSEKKRLLEETKSVVSATAQHRAETERARSLWTVSQMARAVGREDQYVFLYSYLSQQTHGSPSTIKRLLEQGSGTWEEEIPDVSLQSQVVGGAWLLLVVNELAKRYGWTDVEEDTQRAMSDLGSD